MVGKMERQTDNVKLPYPTTNITCRGGGEGSCVYVGDVRGEELLNPLMADYSHNSNER